MRRGTGGSGVVSWGLIPNERRWNMVITPHIRRYPLAAASYKGNLPIGRARKPTIR